MKRSPGAVLGRFGAVLLIVIGGAALLAPLLAGYGPMEQAGPPDQSPSLTHPLGTNDIGHDLFAQFLYGARMSLTIGLAAAALALAAGAIVAVVAAYRGGLVDAVAMRLVDLTLAFPFIPLVLVLAAFFGRSLLVTVSLIALVIWAQPARVLRSQVLKALSYGHVQAAEAMGVSTPRILGRHLLPRAAPLAAAQFVRAANIAIGIEAALSFLGLGDPNRMSWGTMLFFANAHNVVLTDAWLWWILPPALGLTVTTVAFAFVGYALEEWGDRRLAGSGPARTPALERPSTSSGGAHQPPAEADDPAAQEGGDRPPALQISGLEVHYGGRAEPVRAVAGVGLSVARDSLVGLVGESGSGKSTLAQAVLGLTPEDGRVMAGSIRLDGRELTGLSGAARRRLRGRQLGYVPQSAMNALNPTYTLGRQIAESAALTRENPAEVRERTAALLDLVELPRGVARSYPHQLSGGMRQRAVLAIALAGDPALLIADEPMTGLDVITQARMMHLLVSLRQRLGLAVLLISHDIGLVLRFADRIAVMQGGHIVEHGSASEVALVPAHSYTQELLQTAPRLPARSQ